MTLDEGKQKFLQSWGALGSSWGINRTMAQIHALLLISPEALSADEIMEELMISRGNANMNIRALIMWEVVKCIITQRKKRELEPMLKAMDELSSVPETDEMSEAFVKVIRDIKLFGSKADSTLDTLTKSDSNWFVGTFMKMIR
jgi:hypothetical protein